MAAVLPRWGDGCQQERTRRPRDTDQGDHLISILSRQKVFHTDITSKRKVEDTDIDLAWIEFAQIAEFLTVNGGQHLEARLGKRPHAVHQEIPIFIHDQDDGGVCIPIFLGAEHYHARG
jgi:hypothetical protein